MYRKPCFEQPERREYINNGKWIWIDFQFNYQFNLHVVLCRNDESPGGSWKGAVEKAKSAQLGGVVEVLARLHNVYRLSDYER